MNQTLDYYETTYVGKLIPQLSQPNTKPYNLGYPLQALTGTFLKVVNNVNERNERVRKQRIGD